MALEDVGSNPASHAMKKFTNLRVGRKVGRTLYLQIGNEPSDDDELIGIVDTVMLAKAICLAFNGYYGHYFASTIHDEIDPLDKFLSDLEAVAGPVDEELLAEARKMFED